LKLNTTTEIESTILADFDGWGDLHFTEDSLVSQEECWNQKGREWAMQAHPQPLD